MMPWYSSASLPARQDTELGFHLQHSHPSLPSPPPCSITQTASASMWARRAGAPPPVSHGPTSRGALREVSTQDRRILAIPAGYFSSAHRCRDFAL